MAKLSDAKSGTYCTCTRERCSDECRTYKQFRPKPVTNADRIRSMSDEELAFYIVNHPMWTDESACVNWLKQEATDGKQNQPAP